MRVAPAITLDQQQRNQLQVWARGRSLPQRQVERAKIILLAAAGKQDIEIAAALRMIVRRPHAAAAVFCDQGWPA